LFVFTWFSTASQTGVGILQRVSDAYVEGSNQVNPASKREAMRSKGNTNKNTEN